MNLSSVEIVNFRSIKETTITFEPKCRILVGINESGKSNILKALRLLNGEFKPSKADDVREPGAKETPSASSYIRFVFKLEQADTAQVFSFVSKRVLATKSDPVVLSQPDERLSKFCHSRDEGLFHVDIAEESRGSRSWRLPGSLKIAPGWKKPSAACPADYKVTSNGEARPLAGYELVKAADFPDVPDAYFEDATIADLSSVVGQAIRGVVEKNLPKVVFWEYRERDLLPNSIDLSAFTEAPDSCVPLKHMFALAGIPENKILSSVQEKLKGSANKIQNYFDQIADKTTAHFRQVWREYRGISFSLRWSQGVLVPGVKESNTHDFKNRSDGFKRFVTFLLMISVKVKVDDMQNTLLLIDEPEISLHPSGARYLRDELIRISRKNYVVYSTHSIFMVDAENIGKHYIVKKKGEVTHLTQAEKSNLVDEEVLWNALGYSVFDILKEKNLIFEGWKDKHLFNVAISSAASSLSSKFTDVGICHANGASSVKALTPPIELAKRSCFIISDGDAPARQEQKLYKAANGYGTWLTYQNIDPSISAQTGEDFLRNDVIVDAVNNSLVGQDMPVFSENDLLAENSKLKAINQWLIRNGKKQNDAKDVVGHIKTILFDNLDASHIGDEYIVLLQGIAKLLEQPRA